MAFPSAMMSSRADPLMSLSTASKRTLENGEECQHEHVDDVPVSIRWYQQSRAIVYGIVGRGKQMVNTAPSHSFSPV